MHVSTVLKCPIIFWSSVYGELSSKQTRQHFLNLQFRRVANSKVDAHALDRIG